VLNRRIIRISPSTVLNQSRHPGGTSIRTIDDHATSAGAYGVDTLDTVTEPNASVPDTFHDHATSGRDHGAGHVRGQDAGVIPATGRRHRVPTISTALNPAMNDTDSPA